MIKSFLKNIFLLIIISITALHVFAQKVNEPKTTNAEYKKPFPPFRIAGNLYYVGTYDLACYLITTNKGNILINTGLASSAKQIKQNIKTLGFKFKDIKILLNTQAHYDHLGAMAVIKKKTKAQLMVDEKDAPQVESGGSTDYTNDGYGSAFKPIKINRLLHNGDTIQLGDMQLIMLHHPGHTKGSCSFLFTVKDEKQSYKVLIANMPSIVTSKSFDSISNYTKIKNDYAYTLNAMKNIKFDIWLASHASQFALHKKHKLDDAYNPATFKDQAGYDDALKDYQEAFDKKIKK